MTEPLPSAHEPRQIDESFAYAACFCEENVYLLCRTLLQRSHASSALYAVFISNEQRQVPLWQQRAATVEGWPVFWDYHVLLLECKTHSNVYVWDLDSLLELPSTFEHYIQHALLQQHNLPTSSQRRYRVVPATRFLANFASDRSHMINADGTWLSAPPPWPCIITTEGATATLHRYLDMQLSDHQGHASDDALARAEFGLVLSEHNFIQSFAARQKADLMGRIGSSSEQSLTLGAADNTAED